MSGEKVGANQGNQSLLAMQGQTDGIEQGRVELGQYIRHVLDACDQEEANLIEVFNVLWRTACTGVRNQHQNAWRGFVPSDVSWLQSKTGWTRAELFEALYLVESRVKLLDPDKIRVLQSGYVSKIVNAHLHPDSEIVLTKVKMLPGVIQLIISWVVISILTLLTYLTYTVREGDLDNRRYLGWKWYKPWVWLIFLLFAPGWAFIGIVNLIINLFRRRPVDQPAAN